MMKFLKLDCMSAEQLCKALDTTEPYSFSVKLLHTGTFPNNVHQGVGSA